MFTEIINTIRPKLFDVGVKVAANSPEIYLGLGLVLGVGAVIGIARAHKKQEERRIEFELEREAAVANLEEVAAMSNVVATVEEYRAVMTPPTVKFAVETVKAYGPGVLMGVGSVAAILMSHGVLRGRLGTAVSALAFLEQSFRSYRGRVVDELGTGADERFYTGSSAEFITVVEVDEETGKTKKTKMLKNVFPEQLPVDVYFKTFDSRNRNWTTDDAQNAFFLRGAQTTLNNRLEANGTLLLNEVYSALGFKPTPYGAVVGWSIYQDGPNYVDLGLDHPVNQNPGETSWRIMPNVNGVVVQHLGNYGHLGSYLADG